jgi:hypothetical protein
MRNMVLWIVTPCSPEAARRYGGTFVLRLQGQIVNQVKILLQSNICLTILDPIWGAYKWSTCGVKWNLIRRPLHASVCNKTIRALQDNDFVNMCFI